MPICGLARRIHATVNRIPGMISGMTESAKKTDLERRVGALVHPRECRAEHEREERRTGRELNRGPEQPPGVAAAVGHGIVADREDGIRRRRLRRAEALPEQESKRDHGDVDREGDARADHDPLPVEAARLTGTGWLGCYLAPPLLMWVVVVVIVRLMVVRHARILTEDK